MHHAAQRRTVESDRTSTRRQRRLRTNSGQRGTGRGQLRQHTARDVILQGLFTFVFGQRHSAARR